MNILVSNASRDPIYEQISRQVRTQIVNGTLEAGDILPSIRALARELQVSVITTKRAYDDLEKEGFIDSVTGKGSFVAAQNPEFLREKQMRTIEEKLTEAVDSAKNYGVEKEKLQELIELLYVEEDV
ncbi:MAG: GntR family transcriptional regulator [Bacteroidetes bacterium]|nr:GntR family transcriptional regulator [Bacteroidota bacterium]